MEDMGLYNIIFTSGSFDLLHVGHLNILLQAKALGKKLIVGVSSDELIEAYKGLPPVVTYADRVALIKELRCVDMVIKQAKLVDITQFKELKADVFVLGDDWKERYDNEGINWLRDNDKMIWVPYTKRLSTTAIKQHIITNAEIIQQSLLNRKNKD
jgi:glycerol-3-phosphate cytidylyltransferase